MDTHNRAPAQAIYAAALGTRDHAYAPYSHFKVGAAVHVVGHNEIISGCNVENVSFGATVCAERIAIFQAVARYGTVEIDELVVVTDDTPPAVPCALCLQVLQEFCRPELRISLANLEGIQSTVTLADLLPRPFSAFRRPHQV
jgi:homotetrameric cytidine deaminase